MKTFQNNLKEASLETLLAKLVFFIHVTIYIVPLFYTYIRKLL